MNLENDGTIPRLFHGNRIHPFQVAKYFPVNYETYLIWQ